MTAARVQAKAANGIASPCSVVLDAAPIQGNLLVAAITNTTNITLAPGAGWTELNAGASRSAAFYKIASAGESATQSPATHGGGESWNCGIVEYSGTAASSVLDASGRTSDGSSPQDITGVNPTDSIQSLMVGIAVSEDPSLSWSGQTIGGAAATEVLDNGTRASLTIFERLNVDTGVGTWAAQATCSGVPNGGHIWLLIFKLRPAATVAGSQPAATGVLARLAQKMRALAGLQPAATGLLSRRLVALHTLAGAQEAASGILTAVKAGFTATLAGAQEAATGTLSAVLTHVRNLAGSQAAPSGILTRGLYTGGRVLEGIQAAASGVLSVLAPTPNVAGTATLTEALQDTATLSEALRDTATLTVVPLGG